MFKKKNGIKTALILSEPPSVAEENWNTKLHKVFDIIFTWNDCLIDEKKYFKIPAVPQPVNYPNPPVISFQNKKILVNISRNKFSSHPKELYSERLKSIQYFENNQKDNFDLYGVGWNLQKNLFQRLLLQKNCNFIL